MARAIGIAITAQDSASTVFKAVGKVAKSTAKSTDQISQAATKSVASVTDASVDAASTISDSIASTVAAVAENSRSSVVELIDTLGDLNLALRLVSKAQDAWQSVVTDSVDAALSLRDEADEVSHAFEKIDKQSKLLQVRLGEILIPILLGVEKGYLGVGDSVHDVVEENRELISLGITDTLTTMADALVDGVEAGAVAAAQAIGSLREGYVELKNVALEALATLIDKMVPVAEQAEILAQGFEFFGVDIGEAVTGAAGKLRLLSVELRASKEDAVAARVEIVQQTEAQVQAIERTAQVTRQVVDDVEKAVKREIRTFTAAVRERTTLEKQQLEQRQAFVDRLSANRIRAIELQLELEESVAARQRELDQERVQRAVQNAAVISGAFSSATQALLVDQKSASEVLDALLVDLARKAVSTATQIIIQQALIAASSQASASTQIAANTAVGASNTALATQTAAAQGAIAATTAATSGQRIAQNAAVGASGAAASQAGIPIIGPALAATAAAAVFALIIAFRKKMKAQKFALGGLVTGGIPGMDSVPALLTPGERVLTPSQARRMDMGTSERGGAQAVNLSVNVSALDVPSRQTRRALVNGLAGDIEEAIMDGRIRLAPRTT